VERPDEAKLVESAINGMLTSLDPHSSFMDAKSFRDMQVQTRGEFGGLGIEVTMEEGLVKVVTPIDETPASRAGVLANDIITHINDEQVQGLTLNQAVEKMRGPVNSAVKLKIQRKEAKDPIEVSLTRETIRVRPVRARLEGGDIGVLRVSQFNEQTFENLRTSIDKLTTEAGGDLTKGKPLVVLVNGGSASASEIVAGALQDHKRALVMGTRSFGKGSVQTIIPLGGNGAVRLTTARYYTPSGRSIQAKGIDPDREILQEVPDELKGKDETKGEAGLRGHLKNDKEERGGSSAYVPPDPAKDKQLAAAYEHLRGTRQGAANTAPTGMPN
jgi:carboxyl-terminal processing protease